MKDLLQSSTQEAIVFGPIISSTDHISPVTGLTSSTLTVVISKNGGAFASPSGTLSEIGNGWYKLSGNATDTNTPGSLLLHATSSSSDAFDERFQVVAFNTQDAIHLGLSALPNTACATNGSLITAGTGTSQLFVSGGGGNAIINSSTLMAMGSEALVSSGGQPATTMSWPVSTVQPMYGGQLCYYTNGYYLWYDNVTNNCWVISAAYGTYGSNYYQSSGDEIGPWTGHGAWTAAFTAFYSLRRPSSSKNPGLATVNSDGTTKADVRDVLGTAYGGTAGKLIDMAQVANPTQSLNLSGTTIATSQQVASVSGAVGSVTGNVGGSVASVTGNVGGNVVGSVGSISGVTFPANFSSISIDASGRLLLQPTQPGSLIIPTVTTVSGSVGSVTGNVGGSVASVAGNVAGNVVGSVGSISGVTFPSNFGSFSIDTSGRVLLQPTQPGSLVISTVTTLTNAPQDTSGTTTLLSRLTAARAGYLDNLNVGGAVASHSDITGLNLSATKHLFLATVGQYAPGESYAIELDTFSASTGASVNADSTPTIAVTGSVSGSLAANLGTITNPATGVYRVTYTVPTSPTLEQIRVDASATISGSTFTTSTYTQTVDAPTAAWTSTDKSNLTAIFNKLPTNNLADETLLLSAIGTPLQASSYTAPPTAASIASATTISLGTGSGLTSLAQASSVASEIIAAEAAIIAAIPSATTIATAVLTDTTSGDLNVAGSPGKILSTLGSKLPANAIADETLVLSATDSILAAIGSTLQSSVYSPPPSVDEIAAATAAVLFMDGSTNQLKVNSDHTVNVLPGVVSAGNYIALPAAVVQAEQIPTILTCVRGDTLRVVLPQLGNVGSRTKLVMTAKVNFTDTDDQAVFQIIETVGLARLYGQAGISNGAASLTVADSTLGIFNLEIDASVTAQFALVDLVWDVQVFLSSGIVTPIIGTISVVADVTQAVS